MRKILIMSLIVAMVSVASLALAEDKTQCGQAFGYTFGIFTPVPNIVETPGGPPSGLTAGLKPGQAFGYLFGIFTPVPNIVETPGGPPSGLTGYGDKKPAQ